MTDQEELKRDDPNQTFTPLYSGVVEVDMLRGHLKSIHGQNQFPAKLDGKLVRILILEQVEASSIIYESPATKKLVRDVVTEYTRQKRESGPLKVSNYVPKYLSSEGPGTVT